MPTIGELVYALEKMMQPQIHEQILNIIEAANDMTIATVRGDGYPQATTVSFVNDGMTIYFGTSSDSQKSTNLANNNKISLTINRDYRDWDEIEGLSMGGKAHLVVDTAEEQRIGELLFEKFPQIAQYAPEVPDTSVAFYRIDPEFISLLDYQKGFGHTESVTVQQSE